MAEDTLYTMNEGTLPLDVPGTWEDQTIHVLRLPGDGRATASLVVTREALPVGMEVADYMLAELKRLRETLPGFELRGRAPIAWEGARAGDGRTGRRSGKERTYRSSACSNHLHSEKAGAGRAGCRASLAGTRSPNASGIPEQGPVGRRIPGSPTVRRQELR